MASVKSALGAALLVSLIALGPLFAAEGPLLESLEEFRAPSGILRASPSEEGFLLEVMLLEMDLRLLLDQREAFDGLADLLDRYFRSPLGVYYIALDSDMEPLAWENRTALDLMACRIFLKAGRKWPQSPYRAKALGLAGQILRYDVMDGLLTEGLRWKERSWQFHSVYSPQPLLKLSSVDLSLLLELQGLSAPWAPVVQRSLGLLMAGAGGEGIQEGYDLKRRRYTGQIKESFQFLVTLCHLTDGGFVPQRAVEGLRRKASMAPLALAPSVGQGAMAALVLSLSGERGLALEVMAALRARFASQEGALLAPAGEMPSIRDNLIYLIVSERLAQPDEGPSS